MSEAVETPTPLAGASAAWIATIAIGLAVFAVAAGGQLALAALDEPLRGTILMPALRRDEADVALALAMLHDGGVLLAALGLVLLARPEPSRRVPSARRGAWLAIALLVATCVGEHVLVATRTIVTRTIAFGPAGDPLWRLIVVDGRHLAWSVAIAVALRRVADVLSSRRARSLSIAWPLAAAGVVAASRLSLFSAGRLDAIVDVPMLLASVAEFGLLLWTTAIVVRAEWRFVGAYRVARRREDNAAPDDRPADACVRCGYDLRGIADDAACPECGLLAGRSRTTAAAHLRDAPPAWLRGISIGVMLVLIAEALGAAWPCVLEGVVLPNVRWGGGGFPLLAGTAPPPGPTLFGIPVDLNLLVHAPAFACAAMLFVGVWLLTRPQRAGARDDVLRSLLRAFAIVPTVAFAMTLWDNRNALTGRPSLAINYAAIALLTAGCAPIPALMFALLRRLAQRVLNANLAEHSTIVGVGLALTLLAIPPVAVAMSQLDLSRSDAGLVMMLTILVAFVLFAGWSALNCIRFALAFRRAEREARALWTDADHASGEA